MSPCVLFSCAQIILNGFLSRLVHLRILYFVYFQILPVPLSISPCPSAFVRPSLLSLTWVEWQAVQARCIGCPFGRTAAESKVLPHCLTSSLTAWNNTVLTDTWSLVWVDKKEEKVGVRGSFNANPLIRGLTLMNCRYFKCCTLIKKIKTLWNMTSINPLGAVSFLFKCFSI